MPDEYVDPIKKYLNAFFKCEKIMRLESNLYEMSDVIVIRDFQQYKAGEKYSCIAYYPTLDRAQIVLKIGQNMNKHGIYV